MTARATFVCLGIATVSLAIGCSTKLRREHAREEPSVEEPTAKSVRPTATSTSSAVAEEKKAMPAPSPPPIASAPPPIASEEKPLVPGDIEEAMRRSMKREGDPAPTSVGRAGDIDIPAPGSPLPPAPPPAKTVPTSGRCACLPSDPLCSC